MQQVSAKIMALKPVTFRYKDEIDPSAIPQFGLVAEDVEKVDPTLVVHDEQGRPYTVRYDAINAMLLNEFLKEHRKMEQLEDAFAPQQKKFEARSAQQQKQIDELRADVSHTHLQLNN